MIKIPPFYENFDNTHCYQCMLRGVLEYFEPNEIWDWDTWDAFTRKEEGKGTWPEKGLVGMADRGYMVKRICPEDFDGYLTRGIKAVLVEMSGQEIADYQEKTSPSFDVLEKDIKAFLSHDKIDFENRVPSWEDVTQLLDDGFLVSVNVNSYKLNKKEGYTGHFILLYDYDDQYVTIQDSNFEHSGRKVLIEDFLAAATDPTPEQFDVCAYKLEKKK